jgi:antitoxin component HigA of HigAB toxin-antitoxin module
MAPFARVLRTRSEFDDAVAELDVLANADPKEGSPAYDFMELLTVLIAAYEDEHLPPLKPASPRELAQFISDQKLPITNEARK